MIFGMTRAFVFVTVRCSTFESLTVISNSLWSEKVKG